MGGGVGVWDVHEDAEREWGWVAIDDGADADEREMVERPNKEGKMGILLMPQPSLCKRKKSRDWVDAESECSRSERGGGGGGVNI